MSVSTILRPPPAPIIRSSLAQQRRNRLLDVLIVVGLIAVVALTAGINIAHFPVMQDDEGTYTSQAWAIQHGAMAHYTYWYDHPPLGWIEIGLLSWIPQGLHLGGQAAIASTRFVMLLLMLINTGLLYGTARRLGMLRAFAAATVLLWALCPLTIYQSRQVYLDNTALTWVLLAVFLVLTPKKMLWHFAGAGAAMALAVLCKETTALLLPMIVWLMWRNVVPALRSFVAALSATSFGSIVMFYPIFAVLRSELFPGKGHVSLLGALTFQFATRQSSGSLLDPKSDKRLTIGVWLGYDHYLVAAGLLAAVVVVLLRRQFWPVALGVALGLVPVVKQGYLPTMYVIVYLPLLALCAGGLADALWTRSRRPAVPSTRLVLGGLVLGLLGLALTVVAPVWASSDQRMMTTDATAMQRDVIRYLTAQVPHSDSVLVDDSYWLDLVQHGFSGDGWHGAIWYYKIDLDPISQRKHLPQGWKNVDYIVYNDAIRQQIAASPSPIMQAAVQHSRVVAEFGSGDPIQILQVLNGRHNSATARAAKVPPPAQPPSTPDGSTAPAPTGPVDAATVQRRQEQVRTLELQFGMSVNEDERIRLLAEIDALTQTPGVSR